MERPRTKLIRVTIGLVVLALTAGAFGCGGETGDTVTTASATTGTTAVTSDTTATTEAAPETTAAEDVYAKFNAMTGQERHDALVAAAEEEGELNVYTSNTDMDKLVDAFEDLYKIDVNVYRGNSESVLQRVLQEQEASYFGNDILETNALELNVAQEKGFLSEYVSELRDKVRPEGLKPMWTASRFNVFVVGWNTELVKPGEEPKTLEDLADPKWKGKISMEIGDVDWFTALYDYYTSQGKTNDEIVDFFSRLASNAKVVKGHTVQGELLSAGQFSVALSLYSHTVDKAVKKGAPVAWKTADGSFVQPLVVRPNGEALMKTALHPAAALLFMDFELAEGQQVIADATRIGSVADGANDPLAGATVIEVPEDKLLNEGKKWDDLYAQILKGGEKVK